MRKEIKWPRDIRYSVVLDSSEIYEEDPGNGTPEMVYYKDGKFEASATLNCVLGEGELMSGDDMMIVPERFLDWLVEDETLEAEVCAMHDAGHNGDW
jgi:hypothetical protein